MPPPPPHGSDRVHGVGTGAQDVDVVLKVWRYTCVMASVCGCAVCPGWLECSDHIIIIVTLALPCAITVYIA